MLQQTPSKADIRNTKTEKDLAVIMAKYLAKWDKRSDNAEAFAKLYIQKVQEKAASGQVRLPLPHNLGYVQVLEHVYEGLDKKVKIKYLGVDFSMVWVKHPMYKYHTIKTKPEVTRMLRKKRDAGVKFLKEYVDGDTFVI